MSESEEISPEMRALFNYLRGEEPGSELTRRIAESVSRAKTNRMWEREYMTFEEKLKEKYEAGHADGREEGRAEGREEGEDRFASLADALIDAGRVSDVKTAKNDPVFRQKMYEEYGIE